MNDVTKELLTASAIVIGCMFGTILFFHLLYKFGMWLYHDMEQEKECQELMDEWLDNANLNKLKDETCKGV